MLTGVADPGPWHDILAALLSRGTERDQEMCWSRSLVADGRFSEGARAEDGGENDQQANWLLGSG
jgi:hypothetical protein